MIGECIALPAPPEKAIRAFRYKFASNIRPPSLICPVPDISMQTLFAGWTVNKVREFIDFWIENSIHAREQYGSPGAEQGVTVLVQRLIANAKDQGFSEADMVAEVGNLAAYVRGKLGDANQAEKDRFK